MVYRIFATLVIFILPLLGPQQPAQDNLQNASAAQIIQEVNALRTAKGLPALRINSILMNTAQYTADIMATQLATSHIGNMKDRIVAAGYGSGYPASSIFGTENFAVGEGNETAHQIVLGSWSDDLHMIPMTNTHMCDVGAGVSLAGNGTYYYVLHAAYNSDVACNSSTSSSGTTTTQTGSATDAAPQWIIPISRATPDDQGKVWHIVRQGQSLWSIAIAYGTKINSILQLNNLPLDTKTTYSGEKLLIPTSLTPLPTDTEESTATDMDTDIPVLTGTPALATQLPTLTRTPQPSPTPTIDPNSQAMVDERFRGGLFLALVISLILITGGLLLRKR